MKQTINVTINVGTNNHISNYNIGDVIIAERDDNNYVGIISPWSTPKIIIGAIKRIEFSDNGVVYYIEGYYDKCFNVSEYNGKISKLDYKIKGLVNY